MLGQDAGSNNWLLFANHGYKHKDPFAMQPQPVLDGMPFWVDKKITMMKKYLKTKT